MSFQFNENISRHLFRPSGTLQWCAFSLAYAFWLQLKDLVVRVNAEQQTDSDPLWKQLYDCRPRSFSGSMLQQVILPSSALMKKVSSMRNELTLPQVKEWVSGKMDLFLQIAKGRVDEMKLPEILDVMDGFTS